MTATTASSSNRRVYYPANLSPRKVLNGIGRTMRRFKITRVLPRRGSNGYGAVNTDALIDYDDEVETNHINNIRNNQDHGREDGGRMETGELINNAKGMSDPRNHNAGMTAATSATSTSGSLSQIDANIIYSIEKALRLICLLLFSFYLGATQGPSIFLVVLKVLEYTFVAWVTCVLILFVLRRNTNTNVERMGAHSNPNYIRNNTGEGMIQTPQRRDEFSETNDTEFNNTTQTESSMLDNGEARLGNLHSNDTSTSSTIPALPNVVTSNLENKVEDVNEMKGQHPEVKKLHIITSDGLPERIIPNTIVRYESDLCVGNISIMIRTPDADVSKKGRPPNVYGMCEQALRVSDYFRPKQRRFAFQFQVKLKEIPKGEVYMGVEFDEPIKMGVIQRALAHAALGFVKKTNRGFHYSLTGGDGKSHHFPSVEFLERGEYELPHMAFPILGCMDLMVATKPGEPLPPMGGELYERPESIKSRRNGGQGDFPGWNLEDTYTMVVYSAYVDWLTWKCVNLPGIRPFSLCALSGDQAVNMTTYVYEGDDDVRKPHFVKDKVYISSLEFSSAGKSSGKTVKKWEALIEAGTALQRSESGFLAGDEENNTEGLVNSITVDDTENEEEIAIVHEADEADEGEDDDVVEELGVGMYLRCGDHVLLTDASQAMEEESLEYEEDISYVTNSFGFAVMQSQSPSSIVFEKAGPSYQDPRRRNRSKSKLVRDGDTVLIKILTEKHEYKYLTLFKGWWLKWVSHVPRKNGYFKIYSIENEGYGAIHKSNQSIEIQSSYLSIGAPFTLRHRRWPGFEVGIGIERSSKFGGLILGLHPIPKSINNGGLPEIKNDNHPEIADKKSKFRTFRFCAHPATSIVPDNMSCSDLSDQQSSISMNNIRLDATAWIEMMHRTKRTKQRAYLVRAKYYENTQNADLKSPLSANVCKGDEKAIIMDTHGVTKYTARLRTGQDLAPLLQIARNQKNLSTTNVQTSVEGEDREESKIDETTMRQIVNIDGADDDMVDEVDDLQDYGQLTDQDYDTDLVEESNFDHNRNLNKMINNLELPNSGSVESMSSQIEPNFFDISSPSLSYERNESYPISENENELLDETRNINESKDMNQSEDDNDLEFVVCNEDIPMTRQSVEYKKKKKWMKTPGRVASKTSKQMVKQTVNAGRFISKGIVQKKKKRHPTRKEPRIRTPKQSKRGSKKKWRDHYVAVNKVMKNYSPLNSKGETSVTQMNAPDQSLLTVSQFLSHMTTDSDNLALRGNFTALFHSKFGSPSELDTWFLRGDAAELGVTQSRNEGDLVHDALVARCLWESHWREEWCGIYKDHISFYAPLRKKAIFSLMISEILDVRKLDLTENRNPIPGLSYIVIESVWRCHYLAFNFCKTRDSFLNAIDSIRSSDSIGNAMDESKDKQNTSDGNEDAWISNQWANFHALDESFLSDGRGKWARITSSNKSKKRIILNCRRMAFDTQSLDPNLSTENEGQSIENTLDISMAQFSKELLVKALSLSLNTMEKDVEGFAGFLDLTSRLRSLPIHLFDFNSNEAFCFFVNIYHCLLQHTLLLDGPPNKRSVRHFMRCNCYEIGGSAFSLSELECFIIRGELSRIVNPKGPYVNAPKASKDYQVYSLTNVDPRINFVLNNGCSSNLSTVPVLSPDNLEMQLEQACSLYLRSTISVDTRKQLITLPKVCEVYKNDFDDGNALHCLYFCIRFLEEELQKTIVDLVNKGFGGYVIKYQPASETFHSSLNQMTFTLPFM